MAKEYMGEHSLRSLTKLIKETLALKADSTKVAEDIANAIADKLAKTDIVDALNSTDATKVLSANQGKVLDEKITAADGKITALESKIESEVDSKTEELTTKVTTLEGEMDTVQGKIEGFDADGDGTVDKAKTADTATNATQLDGHTADYFIAADTKGQANGVAPLDSTGKVSSEYLPSYVDDVIEGKLTEGEFYAWTSDEQTATAEEPSHEKGKIYVDTETNTSYRWSGSTYVKIVSDDLVEISEQQVQAIWQQVMAD